MREATNPFFLRAAENLADPELFLRLYAASALEVVSGSRQPWQTPYLIQSTPGAGKTTLLRLFRPDSLVTLGRLAPSDPDLSSLATKVSSLGALESGRPNLLGVFLGCTNEYADLARWGLEGRAMLALFAALLNARLLIVGLDAVLALHGERTSSGSLDRVQVHADRLVRAPFHLPNPCSGQRLREWASEVEAKLCREFDSLSAPDGYAEWTTAGLAAAELLDGSKLLYNGNPAAQHTVLLLDDVHKLDPEQRRWLHARVIDDRQPVGVWLAERLTAMESAEVLSGSLHGRDYETVYLDERWRGQPKAFQRLATDITRQRAQQVGLPSLDAGMPLGPPVSIDFGQTIGRFRDEVVEASGDAGKVHAMVTSLIPEEGATQWDELVAWRAVRVLQYRRLRPQQGRLFDEPVEAQAPADSNVSPLKEAAALFLSEEFSWPYYFGWDRLAKLGSQNIQQMLGLSGELYELLRAARLRQKGAHLEPKQQHDTVIRWVRAEWDRIPVRVEDGERIRQFLDRIGAVCREETHRPNAPYAPGVTGIAVTEAEFARLRKALQRGPAVDAAIARWLAAASAHHLVEIHAGQRCKGKTWAVIYLNRQWCPLFSLPLQYGGWRERPLWDLRKWVETIGGY